MKKYNLVFLFLNLTFFTFYACGAGAKRPQQWPERSDNNKLWRACEDKELNAGEVATGKLCSSLTKDGKRLVVKKNFCDLPDFTFFRNSGFIFVKE